MLFVIAVLAVTAATNLGLALIYVVAAPQALVATQAQVVMQAQLADSLGGFLAQLPAHFWLANTAALLVLMLGATVREAVRLSAGGPGLAALLGARAVPPESVDPGEQRLRSLAHETSIAFGAPMPSLYVLDDEDSVNACVAGHDARDAAVIVTRGALARLTRDELQGLYAHEFAHVLHGDAALNLRMTAWVSGLMVVYQFGHALRSWARPEESAGRGRIRGGPVAQIAFAAGTLVMACGSIGWVAARLLQAAGGRHRGFLADSAAVRFTRLPLGLGNALRKSDGMGARRLLNFVAPVTAHAWLLQPDRVGGWLATHPPVAERVLRIFGRAMPAYTGLPADELDSLCAQPLATPGTTIGFVPTRTAAPLGRQAGALAPNEGARAAIRSWPMQWHAAASTVRRAAGARSVAFALLSPGRADSIAIQGAHGRHNFDPTSLPVESRQALLELAASTLRFEPSAVRKDVLRRARRLIEADERVTLLEFVLYVTLADRLGSRLGTTRRHARVLRREASSPIGLLIRAAMIWPGSTEPVSLRALRAAMERAERRWGATLWWPPGDIPAGEVVAAIRTIGALRPPEQLLAVDALKAAFIGVPNPDPGQVALLRALCHAWGVAVPQCLDDACAEQGAAMSGDAVCGVFAR